MTCYLHAGRKSLVFRMSMIIDLFVVGGPNLLDFSVGNRIRLDFSVGVKLIWMCRWSKLTWCLNAGRKSPVFSVSMQIDLHFVWVVHIDLISVWGIELDLIPV